MGKSRAEIQKAYRERQKAKGPQFLQKERQRSRQNYVSASCLTNRKRVERNHKNKLRNRLSRARMRQRLPEASPVTAEQSSGYDSHLQASNTDWPDSPVAGPSREQHDNQLIVRLPCLPNLKSNKGENLKTMRRRALGKARRSIVQLKREVLGLNRKIKAKNKKLERLIAKSNKQGHELPIPLPSTPGKRTSDLVDSLNLTPRRKRLATRKILLGNILTSEIQHAKSSVSLRKRRLLHRIISGRITKKYRYIKAVSAATGLSRTSLLKATGKSYTLSPERRSCLTRNLTDIVITFLEREDNSRIQPGKSDAKMINGQKKQTRVLTDYMKNLHCKFTAENPDMKLSVASFCRLRPKEILLASFISRNACQCMKHQNMAHMVQALRKNAIKISENPENLLTHQDDLPGYLEGLPDVMKFRQWKRVQVDGHSKMQLVELEIPLSEFRLIIEQQLDDFEQHVATLRHQYRQVKELKEKLPLHHMIIQMDFAENYSCRSLDEIQTAYWNQTSVTLHPTVVYYRQGQKLAHKSFVFISDVSSHAASTVSTFIDKLIPALKILDPELSTVHYWTDSPSSQYRNRYIFDLVANHQQLYGVSAKWNYFEAGHGKGPCDGLGGTTKRMADQAVRQGKAMIQDALQFFNWADTSSMTEVKFIYVSKHECNNKQHAIVSGKVPRPVKNTMKLHAVGQFTTSTDYLMIAEKSCSCGDCISNNYCSAWTKIALQRTIPKNQEASVSNQDSQKRDSHQDQEQEQPSAPAVSTTPSDVEKRQRTDQALCHGDFVAAVYDHVWYLGRIDDIDEADGEFQIEFLERAKGMYRWPLRPDLLWMTKKQILCKVSQPTASGKSCRLFKITEVEHNMIESVFRSYRE